MLSKYGKVVEEGIINILDCYENVSVDQFCIMPDHVHMVLILYGKGEDGRIVSAPTLSSVVGQMKRWVSKRIGFSIWQKSYYDRVIRNEDEYLAICKYIKQNPQKYRKGAQNVGADSIRPL